MPESNDLVTIQWRWNLACLL